MSNTARSRQITKAAKIDDDDDDDVIVLMMMMLVILHFFQEESEHHDDDAFTDLATTTLARIRQGGDENTRQEGLKRQNMTTYGQVIVSTMITGDQPLSFPIVSLKGSSESQGHTRNGSFKYAQMQTLSSQSRKMPVTVQTSIQR